MRPPSGPVHLMGTTDSFDWLLVVLPGIHFANLLGLKMVKKLEHFEA